VNVPSLIDELRVQGAGLADAAGRLEPADAVPTCPGWTVRDLLLHTGGVHRWATVIVREARTEPIALDQPYDIVAELPDDGALSAWFRDGHAELVAALDGAAADLACWAFLPAPTPLAFWARRQAHETAMHRIDLAAAAGLPAVEPTPEFAADGVDELLLCFVSGRNRRLRAHAERTLCVHATDVDTHWLVRIGPDRPRVERHHGAPTEPADDTIAGPAAALYPALWNRTDWAGLTHSGATGLAAVAELWSTGVAVRWT
jgi:uncharacterized protein (TIGR03083 family)